MNKPLCILLLLSMLGACKKDPPFSTTIIKTVFLRYQDSSGQELFSSDTSYLADKLKIYYKNGNNYEFQNLSRNNDYPNGYKVDYSANGEPSFSIFLSDYYSNGKSVTLVELKPNVVDTIVGEFDLSEENEILLQFW